MSTCELGDANCDRTSKRAMIEVSSLSVCVGGAARDWLRSAGPVRGLACRGWIGSGSLCPGRVRVQPWLNPALARARPQLIYIMSAARWILPAVPPSRPVAQSHLSGASCSLKQLSQSVRSRSRSIPRWMSSPSSHVCQVAGRQELTQMANEPHVKWIATIQRSTANRGR